MNKRERLLAAANRRPVDRIPAAFWRHFPGDDQRAADLARATIAFQEAYDFDLVKVSTSNSLPAADWGARTAWRGNLEGTREYVERPIRKPADWRALQPLAIEGGICGEALATLRLLKARWGDSVPFIQTVFNPLMVARYLRGDALWIADLREHPRDFWAGQETITESMARFARAAVEAGAAGLFFASQSASYRQLTEAEYRSVALPNDVQILASANAAGAWFNLLHLHGDDIMFALAREYPVQAVNWHDRSAAPSLAEARAQFDGALVGGLAQHTTLLTGNPDDAARQARDAIAQTGGLGYIVGAGCVLPIPTPDSNIRAALAARDA